VLLGLANLRVIFSQGLVFTDCPKSWTVNPFEMVQVAFLVFPLSTPP